MTSLDEHRDLLSTLLVETKAGDAEWERTGLEDQFIHHLSEGAVVVDHIPPKRITGRGQEHIEPEEYEVTILDRNGDQVDTITYRELDDSQNDLRLVKDLYVQVRQTRPREEGNGKKKHEPTNKYRDTVLALNRRTQREDMAWTRHDEDPRSGRSSSIIQKEEVFEGEYYTASYKNKKFLLYKLYQGKRPRDMEGWRMEIEPGSRLERRLNRPILQILDEKDEQIFEFPPFDVLEELYETVRTKTNEEVETFLNEFLAGEGET
jgi:hypothetical protein